jgi:hypothetical protein
VLLLVSFTVAPPDAAVADKVTVQIVLAPDRRYAPVQSRVETRVPAGLIVRVVVFVVPFTDAVIVTDVADVPETDATVALKAAEDDPAGTVTEAGTFTTEELLVKATVNAAAVGAVSVIVHGTDELEPAEEELQLTDESAAGADAVVTAMLPPVAVAANPLPVSEAAKGLMTPMGTAAAGALASCTLTFATIPLPIAFELTPVNKQMVEPACELQETVLPAATAAGPAVTVMAVTSEAA